MIIPIAIYLALYIFGILFFYNDKDVKYFLSPNRLLKLCLINILMLCTAAALFGTIERIIKSKPKPKKQEKSMQDIFTELRRGRKNNPRPVFKFWDGSQVIESNETTKITVTITKKRNQLNQ